MNKPEYLEIKRQLRFDKPFYPTLGILFLDILLVCAAVRLLELHNMPAYIVSQMLLALFFFHNFGLMHEAGHGNVHKLPWVNTLVGLYSSVFSMMPFYPWKHVHQKHHVWNGNLDMDWTLRRFREMRQSQRVPPLIRFAWRSWLPFFALFQTIFMWSHPIIMWKFGETSKRVFVYSLLSVMWMVVAYIALFKSFPDVVNVSNLWLAVLLYFVMAEIVNLPHHAGVPTYHSSDERTMLHAWEQHKSTRSCYAPPFISELLFMNFNFHIEHHIVPGLPWFRLHHARKLVKPALGSEYDEVGDVQWSIKNRLMKAEKVILEAPTLP